MLYVGVLDLEARIGALHDALAFVADSVAAQCCGRLTNPAATPPPADRGNPIRTAPT